MPKNKNGEVFIYASNGPAVLIDLPDINNKCIIKNIKIAHQAKLTVDDFEDRAGYIYIYIYYLYI